MRLTGAVDPRECAGPVRVAMLDGHRDGTLAGTDGLDRSLSLSPLAPRTIATRPGDGPPTIPRRERSRMIAEYAVDVAESSERRVSLRGHWDRVPFSAYLLDRWPLDFLRGATKAAIRNAVQSRIRAILGKRR